MTEAPAVGIDLGTTYSCVAAFQNDRAIMIRTDTGESTMASCVSFTKTGRLIGNYAKANSVIDPFSTVHGVKRFIGRRFNDKVLQQDIHNYPYEIIDENGNPKIKVEYKSQEMLFAPEQISAMILEKLKEYVERHFGADLRKVVITVPAHFNDSQRQATKDAGKIAGLEVLRVINEPTAAALAYGIHNKYKNDKQQRNILVYDFGGGTFDVSIISVEDDIFEVKATNGDTYLGGDDIDNRLVDYFVNDFEQKHSIDLTQDRRAIRRLRMQCERIKIQLSSSPKASIDIDQLHKGIDYFSGITKDVFESMCADLFEKTLTLVEEALTDAEMSKNDIDEVVLVGGTTRIPKVQELVQAFFKNKKLNTSLNPDEAVAIGAAVQAAILDGDQSDSNIIGSLLLMDVTSLSLGVEIIGGIMSVILPRNTQIPTTVTKGYETADHNQTTVGIEVYEGERGMVSGNSLLGKFKLNGIKAAPRGEAKIDVTFTINSDGILHVSAVEKSGKITSDLSIQMDKNRLNDDDITRMVNEAEKYRREDAKQEAISRSKTSLKNYCDDLLLSVRERFKKVITNEHRQIILVKCEEAIKWLQKNSNLGKEEYEAKQKEVYNVCNPIIRSYV